MLTNPRHDRRVHRQTQFFLESLDARLVLSAGPLSAVAEAVVHHPAADLVHRNRRRKDIDHRLPFTLPLNVALPLRSLYREFREEGGARHFAPSPTSVTPLVVSGTSVAVLIKVAFPPALDAYVRRLRADGLQVVRTVPAHGLAEGTLPIAELPAAAELAAKVWPARQSSLK